MRSLRQRLLVSLAVAGAACFSERVGGSNSAITPGQDCRIPLSVIDSGHVVVAIRGFAFAPDSVAVRPGTTVTWINCEDAGTEPHTTTSDASAWDSPDLVPGARYSHTFPSATGSPFTYHCKPHPYMVGKVIVQ